MRAQTAPRSGIDGFDADLTEQRRYLAGRVPAYEQVLARVQEAIARDAGGDIGRRLTKAWARRTFHAIYDRPLLLLASIRYDALAEGPGHPLWRAVAATEPDPAAATAVALAAALDRTPGRARLWHALTRRHVQTNEVSRAVAWLWPAALLGAGRPLALCDLGASAGLNLVADQLDLGWTLPEGAPLPVARRPRVVRRLGLDLRPLDPSREEDAGWLRACVWPGQHTRLARLEAAIAAFRAARAMPAPPVVERVEARDMPARLVELALAGEHAGPGAPLWLAYQSSMREYLGPSRAPYLEGMRRWLERMPPGRAVWIELEEPPAGATAGRPAALIAHARRRDGGLLEQVIARCDFHPTVVAPDPDGVRALQQAMTPA